MFTLLIPLQLNFFFLHAAALIIFGIVEELSDHSLLPGPDSFLLKVFNARFRRIFTNSHNWNAEDISKFTQSLSESEKNLFASGFHSVKDFNRWKSRQSQQIQVSDLIKTRKRKYYQTE